MVRLKDICHLIDGEKRSGKGICLDAKYLRGKSSATFIEKGKFVYAGDNIILVDGKNSGEVFFVPHDGYMGSTFKQLWLLRSYGNLCPGFYPVLQRRVAKFKKRCSNSAPQ